MVIAPKRTHLVQCIFFSIFKDLYLDHWLFDKHWRRPLWQIVLRNCAINFFEQKCSSEMHLWMSRPASHRLYITIVWWLILFCPILRMFAQVWKSYRLMMIYLCNGWRFTMEIIHHLQSRKSSKKRKTSMNFFCRWKDIPSTTSICYSGNGPAYLWKFYMTIFNIKAKKIIKYWSSLDSRSELFCYEF